MNLDVFRLAGSCMCFDCGRRVGFQRIDEGGSCVLGWLDSICCFAYLCVLGRVIPISKCGTHLFRDEFKKIELCIHGRVWDDSKMKGKMNARE